MSLKQGALEYFKRGLPIVLMKRSGDRKIALHQWKQWQTQRQTEEQFNALPWAQAEMFAVICGVKGDNGLHFGAIDFDVKNVSQEAIDKGHSALKELLVTQIEQTPSGGQHWIYYSENKPKTDSSFRGTCALELLGEGKLCIMYPSKDYLRVNDNLPTELKSLGAYFLEMLQGIGVKAKTALAIANDSQKTNPTMATYRGRDPPCVRALFSGVKPGERNESMLRLTCYLLNRRKLTPTTVWARICRINDKYEEPLERSELRTIFQSAHGKGYVFSCADPLLSKFCVEDDCVVATKNRRKFERRVENL